MSRLRIPGALHATLLAVASCNPNPAPTDASDVASQTDAPAANDVPMEDVPQSCDAVPFVSYCLPVQADAGTVCTPSRVCFDNECTQPGCTFCSFAVECHRMDGSYCFTTCDSAQCGPDCPLIA